MRPPIVRANFELLPGEMVVDNFAGGGGASTGIEAAIGRPVDVAINHSPEAIAMHRANHPETKHFCENIWEVDPRDACGSRPVGLAWFSPDCTHFSKAKGMQPVKKEIRGLAWVVIRWAQAVRPRVIILENVEEFQTWGPLIGDRPDPDRAGETFREWIGQLRDLGYEVEFRPLLAADYGTPTTRRRLFLVARRDGGPIVWPDATHGKGRALSWRPAAEIIDWTLPCRSIFDPTRSRPIVEATLRRIAAGIRRYVIETADPFVISHYGCSVGRPISDPLGTITAGGGGHHGLVTPFVVPLTHQGRRRSTEETDRRGRGDGVIVGGRKYADRVHSLADPMRTITGAHRGEIALATPFLCPIITKHNGGPHGGAIGRDARRPIGTVTTKDQHALTAAFVTKYYGTARAGSSCWSPLPTITTGGGRGGGHLAEVRAFLLKYYGASGRGQAQSLHDPIHTVTTKARFGLVTIRGESYQIVDVGMRMLQPHELFAAQGFPDDYDITPIFNGKPLTKTAQTALAGNSVCPQVAAAIVAENVRHRGAA